jgi:hypothetical protein
MIQFRSRFSESFYHDLPWYRRWMCAAGDWLIRKGSYKVLGYAQSPDAE